ncbi:integrase [Klebsiella pneumoniae]|uniref:Integrase n=1 Tax=Klebsiella pneumoniae TaxID=573 RepID=A0A447RI38_KLEPN|nr:integrase [Klebsiella pneumoniae]
MAFFTIEKRLRSDGTARYRCTVAVKQNGKYVHRENKTFSKNTLAKSWGAKRVAYIEEHGLPEPEKEMKEISVKTVGDLLTQYENHPNITLGASKRSSLRTLGRSFLAEIKLTDLTANILSSTARPEKRKDLRLPLSLRTYRI